MSVRAEDLLKQAGIEPETPLPQPRRLSAQELMVNMNASQKRSENFFERFAADLYTRFGVQGSKIINARVRGDQGFASTALQLTGKVGAGTVMDLIGEVMISGGRGLSNITPDAIEDPIKGGVKYAWSKLIQTDLGMKGLEAARQGLESWQEFADEHPVMARNIEAGVNIGLLVAPVKAKAKKPSLGPVKPKRTGGLVGRAGETIRRSGVKGAIKKKDEFIRQLVLPDQTLKARAAQVGRTTEKGLLRRKVPELTAAQKESARFVRPLKVGPAKTLQGNHRVIDAAITKEANLLAARLGKLGKAGRYSRKEYAGALDDAWIALRDNPALVGDSAKAAERVFVAMRKAADGSPANISALLKARKAFDRSIKAQGREALLNPATENGISMAVRSVRQATNRFIDGRAPSIGVRKSLRKQSALLRAADDIAKKAAKEKNNVIRRSLAKVGKFLGLRNEAIQAAALLGGIGGLGAAAKFAPWFRSGAVLIGVGAVARHLITRPGSRKGLGKLLKLMDEVTLQVTDPAVLKELRADRILIVELLKEAERQEKESD